MRRNKIAIIGAGFVGSTCAHWAAARELGEIVLLDINEGAAQGKALDLMQAGPIYKFESHVTGTSRYQDIEGSDVVVITAGLPRKPGMSRDELVAVNAKIVKEVCEGVKKYAPQSYVIVVCNPMDAMAVYAKQILGFPRERVLGMGGALDSARFRAFIANELNVSYRDVVGMVIGNHGDAMMPLVRLASVNGIPITSLLPTEKINQIVARTKQAGAEIGGLLKTGSAYYAPAAGSIEMVEAILKDQKRVIPCAVELNGEYGVHGLFVGVPCVLGKNGLEKILTIDLTPSEKEEFNKSVQAVQNLVDTLKKL
ncbi:MAG: malate dehydrogenase [Bdellovibrionaceae bacterium]|nr:malate dehydrogenase [Pseudobdellovibrionaceae bacterium]MDW8189445.1 malate dehydrogenase [Pseudobdellovibrionaceae bacterium]